MFVWAPPLCVCCHFRISIRRLLELALVCLEQTTFPHRKNRGEWMLGPTIWVLEVNLSPVASELAASKKKFSSFVS